MGANPQGTTSFGSFYYVNVAASQANAVLTRAVGTRIRKIIVIPSSVDAEAIVLHDGNGATETNITIFTGGVGSLSDKTPFVIDFGEQGIVSRNVSTVSQGWFIDTGAGASIIACVQLH